MNADAPILVVDDDQRIRQMLGWMLEDQGLRVQMASNGFEAATLLREQRPALLLLDMGLPLLDGSGVAEELHTRYGNKVPIVVMTADGHAEAKAQKVGAVAYFHKPFDVDRLMAAIQQALSAG